jgi:hypothetical protein
VNTSKKILLVIGVLGVAVGGFLLTKYLTRNVRNYDYLKETLVEYPNPPASSEDVE